MSKELEANTTLSHYRIISKIGAGGMGEVYAAQDTKLDRKVAIKFLHEEFSKDAEKLDRFIQEAKAASALNHPNILTVYEIGEVDDKNYIATELIDGQTLREHLSSKEALPLNKILKIGVQVAEALSAAHQAGIIHRDVKPENIMLRKDGYAKVLDFGLAKLTERQTPELVDSESPTRFVIKTDSGVVMGTAIYMSPEQARGWRLDARTDIFSFGVVLFEMVTGHLPFAGSNSAEIVASLLSDKESPPLARFSREAPAELERIVLKALRKDRDERYQTSKDLLLDLQRLQRDLQFAKELEHSTQSKLNDRVNTKELATRIAERRSTFRESDPKAPFLKNRKLVAAATLISIIFLTVAGYFYVSRARAKPISSIAVLPFINTNNDPDLEYLANGITDNIIERLSLLPELRVMAHSAVILYKGQTIDVRTVGRDLAVEAVLTGRVVKRNDMITINLELVNATDSSYIWGEQYDRKVADLLTIQREIPVDISEKLRMRLAGEMKEQLARSYTSNHEAYELYLKGRYSWEKWTHEGSRQAVVFYEEALKRDPNYALAYSGLADAYIYVTGVGPHVSQKEAHRRAREAATKALALDPTLGEAHASLADVLLYDDWDFAGAETEFKKAIELSPNSAKAHHLYSHLLLQLGRTEESLAESRILLQLDPLSETSIRHLAYHYLYSRQYDEAIPQFQKDLETYPSAPPRARVQLGDAYYFKGMFREAVAEYFKAEALGGSKPENIEALKNAFSKFGVRGFFEEKIKQLKAGSQTEQDIVAIAEFYARLGEKDQAFEWLEKAYALHADGLVRLKEELAYDSIRSDPRFQDLVRRVGLPP